jgi:hypothetical protein
MASDAGAIIPYDSGGTAWDRFLGWCKEQLFRDKNIYMAADVGFEAKFDKILVLEDEFRSGYECEPCDATGLVKCPECEGSGHSFVNVAIICKICNGAKTITCPTCAGKKEIIVIPEVAQRRPTTGQVVSIGREVKTYKRGQFVLYPSFCGEVMDLSGLDELGRETKIVVRFLKEKETISRVYGHMELRRVRKQQFQTTG